MVSGWFLIGFRLVPGLVRRLLLGHGPLPRKVSNLISGTYEPLKPQNKVRNFPRGWLMVGFRLVSGWLLVGFRLVSGLVRRLLLGHGPLPRKVSNLISATYEPLNPRIRLETFLGVG